LNTADPASALRKGQFTVLSNYYILPDGTLKVRGPYRPWLVASEDTILPDSAPPLTFIIVELRGSDYRVACWDAGANYEVSVYDETNDRWAGEGAGTSIKSNLTDGYKVRFVKYSINEAEDLIFCNGKDTPQRWVGTVDTASSDLGLAAPASPSSLAEASTAVTDEQGIQYDGQYYYKFTAFYDSSGTNTKYGESGPSAVSSAMTVDGADISANTRVSSALTSCPAIPTGATKNYVYRSPPEEVNGPFRRVGYYSSGTSYTDKTPVGEEGVEAPGDAGTPPKLKNPLAYDSRIWGIGINSSGALTNKGVYSNRGMPDMFAADNYIYFPDPLVGPVLFNKLIYWFTEKQIYVTTNLDDPTTSTNKICDIGCDSFDSIRDVGNGLVWQYDGNIYWANFNQYNPVTGDLPWSIGDPIRDKIDNIPTAQRANSAAVFHKGNYYLSITGPNQTVNTSTIVWNVKHGTRLLHQGLFGGWSSMDFSANGLQSFDDTLYTLDNTNRYIMEHDFAGTSDYVSKTEYDAITAPTSVADSASTHTGTASTATGSMSKVGQIGRCFDFAATHHVTVSDHADFTFGDGATDSAFSIAAWVYYEQGLFQTIVSKSSGLGEWILWIVDDDLYLYLIDESASANIRRFAPNISLGWNFVVATYDGSGAGTGITLYVNGSDVSSTVSGTGTYVAMEDTDDDVVIGDFSGGGYPFENKIDNVIIFDKELSAAEVTTLWNTGQGTEGLGTLSGNTMAQWKLNDDSGVDNPIVTQLATGDVHFGNEWSQKLVNSLSIVTETSGITYDATVSFNGNEFQRTKQFTLGSSALAIDSNWLIWGQGTWGNFNWGEKSYGFQSGHKKIAKGGKGRNAKIILQSNDSQETRLIVLKLYYKILPTVA